MTAAVPGLLATLVLLGGCALTWLVVPERFGAILNLALTAHLFLGLLGNRFVGRRRLTWVLVVLSWCGGAAAAFLGYAMPGGQASYWAATMTINMLDAIPVIGHRIVAWLWFDAPLSRLGGGRSALALVPLVLLGVDAATLYRRDLPRGWGWWALAAAVVVMGFAALQAGQPAGAPPAPASFITPSLLLPSLLDWPLLSFLRAGPTKLQGLLLAVLAGVVWLVVPWLRTDRLRRRLGSAGWLLLCLGLGGLWFGLALLGQLPPDGGVIVATRTAVVLFFGWFAAVLVLGRLAGKQPDARVVADAFR